ncbi:response regulator transcription factor [Knoellia locipacati]|uniref:response regulator transcription factor n=1 Tax=Knoellia locipacati TaxID=882824 RepID=UPI00384E9E34
MTRVLLVDDDPLVCGALEMMLSATEDIDVVGSVHDGDQVIDAIHRHRPDILLMDVRMARQDGITTTAALTALPSAPKVIMLTTWDSDDVMLRSVHAGASEFLLKTASPRDIIKHVQDVASGEGALSARSARQLVEHLQSDPARDLRRAAEGLVATLTDRERDVVRCVAREMTTAQIAAELFLGEATVKSHLSSAQLKLGAQNRVGIGIIADRAGLV